MEPQAKNATQLPQVLVVGEAEALNNSTLSGVLTVHAPTLEAAARELSARPFDGVLCNISKQPYEGMALPSLLLDLQRNGHLSNLPVVFWHGPQESKLLEGHAQVAERAGVPVQIIASPDANSTIDLDRVLELSTKDLRAGRFRETHALNEHDLVRALVAADEFRIVLQPQIDLGSGRIVGAEALARWRHPQYGEIPSSTFTPLAHKAGVDLLLFHSVEAKVAALLRKLYWSQRAIPISVSASAETLCTAKLAHRLEQRLSTAGVPNSLLKIEMTKDAPVDDRLALSAALLDMRMRGFSIAIDDFGSGFSSMDLLTQMPFSELKVDSQFVRNMDSDPGCGAAVSAAISIGQAMELDIVAEGIESTQQIAALLEQGCRIGQGIALSPPLEAEDFIRSLSVDGVEF